MSTLDKAQEWAEKYGDRLVASAETKFGFLYKGAVGGMEHVISVDNGAYRFELWRDGDVWFATTGAAIKELPGLAKGAKLDEALDQFFKLTSKVSKAAVKKHYGSSPRRSVPQTHPHFGSKTKTGEKHTHPQPLTSNFKTSGRPRVKKATTYGPSTPHDKPHGGAYNYMRYTNEPDSGVGRHIHKPHGTKTKPYSHSHPAGRVHKASSSSSRKSSSSKTSSSPKSSSTKIKKAVAQVGPSLKIGHKTPSDVSGGNVNPMENKGRKPTGHIGQHGQDCKICTKKNKDFTDSWKKTHPMENKGSRKPITGQSHVAATIHGGKPHWHQGSKRNGYGDYTHSHKPGSHGRGGVGSVTNKMVRMTIKDLRQLIGKGKGYLHGSRMYDSSTPHGRAGSYHSHNESPVAGASSQTSSHEHRKGSHGPVPRGTRKALKKNIMGLDTPEAPQRSTSQPHGGMHSHSGFPHVEDYKHSHEKGTHSPLGDYPGASFPARKEDNLEVETGVNPHGGSEHSHHDLSYPSKSRSKFYSHNHEPSQGHGHKTTNPPGMKHFPNRKRDKLTQGGRISGGVTTPEVARTGGAGQPVGYGSSGSPQYSYARKAGPQVEKHYEGTPHEHKRTMGGSKTNYGGGDHYGNETPKPSGEKMGGLGRRGGLTSRDQQTRHLQHAKKDNCTACSEVSKAVAAVNKLTQEEFDQTHPVERPGHGDPQNPTYHTHQTWGKTPHSHSDFPKPRTRGRGTKFGSLSARDAGL